ncbi:MAG: 2-hydroxymuconate tautomerase family protein [Sulfitobacter sp.]
MTEFAAITGVVEAYFDGLYHADIELLGSVFHPKAIYATADETPLLYRTMDEYFPVVAKRVSPASRDEPRRDVIEGIQFAGENTAVSPSAVFHRHKGFHRLPDNCANRWRMEDHGEDFPYERTRKLRGTDMPFVNIKVTREGVTSDQKAELISGVTDLLVRILDKSPATTFVVIDEVELEDWGVGGLPVKQYRRNAAR